VADYIRERSSGDIVRDSLKIYWANFALIFTVYFFSAFLWEFIYEVLSITGAWPRGRWFFKGLGLLMPFVAGVQLTSVMAQIYMGYEVNIKKVFRDPATLSKAVATGILVLILFPLYPLTMFSVPVVVLENVWGFKALKRSLELGSHYYFRNFLIFIWPYTLYLLVSLFFGLIDLFFGVEPIWSIITIGTKEALVSLITPLAIITTVLLYFDMRIRNEAYDIVSLPEELRK
jgi:hypothetical protein